MFNQNQGFPFKTHMPSRNSNQDTVISSSGAEKSKKSQCIVIDSRHRNTVAYPNPGKFQVKFNASDKTGSFDISLVVMIFFIARTILVIGLVRNPEK